MLTEHTCLCLYARAENARGSWVVGRLVLGEEGRGYGGKLHWPQQRRRAADRLELPSGKPSGEIKTIDPDKPVAAPNPTTTPPLLPPPPRNDADRE